MKTATLSARLFKPFERALRKAGVDPDDFVRRLGMAPEYLRGDFRVRHADVKVLLDAAIVATNDPLLPLHAAELLRPGDFDALEYAVRAAPTLREALVRADRFMRLLHDALELPLVVKSGVATWSVVSHGTTPGRAENEYTLAVVLAGARQFLGLRLRPPEAFLPGPPPADPSEHLRLLADVVHWNAERPAIAFSASALDVRLPTTNPRLAMTLTEHAERLLGELDSAEHATRRVREQIAILLPAGGATIDQIAEKLKMSARTLRRRLDDEGTTFSDELDRVRRELALDYVGNSERTLTEITFLLGFANFNAFHRAFRRWTGRSPSDHRGASSEPTTPKTD